MKTNTCFYHLSLKSFETGTTATSLHAKLSSNTAKHKEALFLFWPVFTLPHHKQNNFYKQLVALNSPRYSSQGGSKEYYRQGGPI